jgi:threonylcarbamoyladenosine tRNA methylthiotransferase MtaB
MSRKIAFRTLGCRLNQFETDSLVSEFHDAGYEVVDFEEEADVYLVNTCTVTNQSDRKSRNLISNARRKSGDALMVITGCMVNSQKESLENLSGTTYLVDNERKTSIFPLVEAHYRGEILHPGSMDPDVFGFKPADTTFHTRSLIKIQDGCDNYCTFCIVPFVRGRAISRPFPEITGNIKKVLDFGFKEIVLTGVNIGRYKYGENNFESLIEKILEIPGDFRVRISSIEPDGYGDRFIELFEHPKLMPHLHLCLQSGSDPVLLKMRRMYTVSEFRSIVNKIRSRYADFNLTSDVIVGFPGETEKDFQSTLDVIEEIGFSHIHTFKYSIRKGTRAARMSEQIPDKTKTRRSEIIRRIAEENKRKYRSSLIGKTQTVLLEKIHNTHGTGYGELYVPVRIHAEGLQRNTFRQVLITGIDEGEDPSLLA